MAIDLDLSTALGRVRGAIGDSSGSLITDDVINYILTSNNDDEDTTIVECLRYIVADLTKKVDQRVDEVDVIWSKLLQQYKDLLDDYLKNPAFGKVNAITLIRGGESKPDFSVGTFSKVPSDTAKIRKGYFL